MLVIYDRTLGKCFTFNTDRSGYEAARDQIRAIRSAGHEAGGDIGRVYEFFNGNL